MNAPLQEARAPEAQHLYQRVGEITRQLHEALRELGHDKRIEATLGAVPDAKARLAFIARLTGDAAEKVLNTVDAAQVQQEALLAQAGAMRAALQDPARPPERAQLLQFAEQVHANALSTRAQLTDIMLAQDFHDLTGQTVHKVVDMAARVEDALLQLLIDVTPAAPARGPLDGPVADASARNDVVASQAQVDDLLASLGF